MQKFQYQKDADGIVTLTMDMEGPVNAMNSEFRQALSHAVACLESETGLRGVVLTSAKKVFLAGADLNEVLAACGGDSKAFLANVKQIKTDFRRLERLPVPVVAAINGTALGGGYELCLSCNHRIAVDSDTYRIGLPEVALGLLPAGGGVVRLVRLLGLQAAIPYLLGGRKVKPTQARAQGLIDELVPTKDALIPQAKQHILKRSGAEFDIRQPWDSPGIHNDGIQDQTAALGDSSIRHLIAACRVEWIDPNPATSTAAEQILNCAISAVSTDFEEALHIETRGLELLLKTEQAAELINAFFSNTKVDA
ncbi:hypothetical protein HBA55_03035 [Pseudomaricurvus alkylphenolicus]|uniref:enoyl-CoA hydratase/isomerase family protein n=1 Tax=Pseudomaricurvus alkylphenolicus TaxID=1306991 RepID=UPI001424934C|nr:enoyl-CoA hydratase-related protein [Pseudomaricurvus alkylphenolicus]NIB38541.1 hypothetical protein [Pseudomaricurvus alkylphenolicus]